MSVLLNKVKRLYDDPVMLDVAENYAKGQSFLKYIESNILLNELEQLKRTPPNVVKEKKDVDSFFKNHLSPLKEPRAIPFLVIETLSKFDTDGSIQRWSSTFPEKATVPSCPQLSDVESLSGDTYSKQNQIQKLAHANTVVSLCAQYSGLRNEKHALRDLWYLYHEPQLVVKIALECRSENIQKQIGDKEVRINKLLRGKNKDVKLKAVWRWFHFSVIAENLVDRKSKKYRDRWLARNIWRSGYFYIECETAIECYTLLGILHTQKSISFIPSSFRDFISNPPPSNYRGLHTTLDHYHQDEISRCRVHIVQRKRRLKPHKKILQEYLSKKEQKNDNIIVYTHKREAREFQRNSTVLDFASHVYHGWVGRVEYAISNKSAKKNLLDKLEHNEEIELVLRDKYDFLPKGWEKVVRRKSKIIRRQLKKNLEKRLIKSGVKEVQSGCLVKFDWKDTEKLQYLLKVSTNDANAIIFGKKKRSEQHFVYTPDWWLIQFGICRERDKYDGYPFESQIDEFKIRIFLNQMLCWADTINQLPSEEVLDKHLVLNADKIMTCNICCPSLHEEKVVEKLKSVLIIHRKGATCAKNSHFVSRQLNTCIGQFFTVEVTDSKNVLIDILKIFKKHDVDLREVVERRLQLGWAVIRLELALTAPNVIDKLSKKIKKLEYTHRVFSPNSSINPLLEEHLPERNMGESVGINSGTLVQPYIVGGVVMHDRHFYGREAELSLLYSEFEYQMGTPLLGGKIFITGPLKTGKTSLSYKFRRNASTFNDVITLVACYEVGAEDAWMQVEQEITEQLKDQAILYASEGRLKYPISDIKNKDLRGLLKLPSQSRRKDNMESYKVRRNASKVVILVIIDEIHRAFDNSDNAELGKSEGFFQAINNSPGAMVISIAPKAVVDKLPDRAEYILRAHNEVEVRPFNIGDSQDLLIAEQLKWRYKIHFNKHHAKDAWKYTDGNPFWLNHLGKEMWTIACHSYQGEVMEFNKHNFRLASEEILGKDYLFKDRVSVEENKIFTDETRLIFIILTKYSKNSYSSLGISKDFLFSKMRMYNKNYDALAFKNILIDLQSTGGIKIKENNIKISSPLLSQWVKNQLKIQEE